MSSKKIDSSQLEKTAGGEKTTAPAGIAVSRAYALKNKSGKSYIKKN